MQMAKALLTTCYLSDHCLLSTCIKLSPRSINVNYDNYNSCTGSFI